MAENSLGVITGGGLIRATANQVDPTKAVWAHSYRVQHYQTGNTGRGYVGNEDLDTGTGEGVFGFVPTIAEAAPWPAYESPVPQGMQHPYNMADVYIAPSVASDEFLVTYVQV